MGQEGWDEIGWKHEVGWDEKGQDEMEQGNKE